MHTSALIRFTPLWIHHALTCTSHLHVVVPNPTSGGTQNKTLNVGSLDLPSDIRSGSERLGFAVEHELPRRSLTAPDNFVSDPVKERRRVAK